MKNELSVGVKEESKEATRCEQMQVEISVKQEQQDVKVEEEELLGSVTRPRHPGLRSSARFIKKVKTEDQTQPSLPVHARETPAVSGRCLQKTGPRNKCLWTNLERNHFFDALHEYGKDYEAIANYINGKLKRRCNSDVCFKTKDQVRQHYYQTFHKLCKYIRFSDEVKKPVQELYALINYGEMRRKLQFVPDKHLMKLKHLVYQGHTAVRFKGKNIRIKTPSCKALRRLNHLDDSLDDIKLPAKIDVIISPFTLEAFGRVQCIAQNPRVRTTVPLNKKLINFIKNFQYKWRSAEAKLAEEEAKMHAANQAAEKESADEPASSAHVNMPAPQLRDGELCFVTKPNVTLHRPLLSITSFLSSGNICLSAYEERLGVKVRGETLLGAVGNQCKRMRTTSDSDKRSPDMKKQKCVQNAAITETKEVDELKEEVVAEEKLESSGDEELSDEIHELLADPETLEVIEENLDIQPLPEPKKEQVAEEVHVLDKPITVAKRGVSAAKTYKPLLDEETMKRIHQGWTLSTAGDITLGDLYVVLGTEGRLELQYYWKDSSELASNKITPITTEKSNALPYNAQDTDNLEYVKEVNNSNNVSNRLKHLLLIANLSERMRRKQCSCGHLCERNNNRARTYISPKVFANGLNASQESGVFRQPLAPARRPICNMDPVKQLNTLQLSKSQKLARQVLVQRMLIPATGNHVQEVMQPPVVGASMPSLDMDAEEIVEPITRISSNKKTKTSSEESPKMASIPNITASTTTTPTVQAATTEPETTKDLNHNTFASSFLSDNNSFNQLPVDIVINAEKTVSQEAEIVKTQVASLPVDAIDENSTSSTMSLFNSIMSPMHLIRDTNSNSRWLEDNLNDFSLTSLLGHLDEITNGNKDLMDPSCNLSVISETSVDYRHKFQEASALIQNQDQE